MDDCGIKTCQTFGLATLTKELAGCLKVLKQARKCRYKHQYENIIKLSKYQLNFIINRVKQYDDSVETLTPKKDLKRDIFQTEVEAEHMQVRINHIRREWLQQQHTLAGLQDSYYHKCELLSAHGNYYAAQGSVLCSIIEPLLDEDNSLQTFLEEKELFFNFVQIASDYFYACLTTYCTDPPVEDSPNFKFIMSLYLCLAKASENPQALALIIAERTGQKFVWNLIHAVGSIQHNSLQNLKALAWVILHNISKNDAGVVLLQGCNTLLVRLGEVLSEAYQPKLFKYCLQIAERLSRDMPSIQYLKAFENNIKVQTLTEFSKPEFEEVSLMPNRILRNVGTAARMFLTPDDAVRSLPCTCTLSEHHGPITIGTSASFNAPAPSANKDKSVQIGSGCRGRKHTHKATCGKRKKHRKVWSPSTSFTVLSSLSLQKASKWKRKKSALPFTQLDNASVTEKTSSDDIQEISLMFSNAELGAEQPKKSSDI